MASRLVQRHAYFFNATDRDRKIILLGFIQNVLVKKDSPNSKRKPRDPLYIPFIVKTSKKITREKLMGQEKNNPSFVYIYKVTWVSISMRSDETRGFFDFNKSKYNIMMLISKYNNTTQSLLILKKSMLCGLHGGIVEKGIARKEKGIWLAILVSSQVCLSGFP